MHMKICNCIMKCFCAKTTGFECLTCSFRKIPLKTFLTGLDGYFLPALSSSLSTVLLIIVFLFPLNALSTTFANIFPFLLSAHTGLITRGEEQELLADPVQLCTTSDQMQSFTRWEHNGRNGLKISVHRANTGKWIVYSQLHFRQTRILWISSSFCSFLGVSREVSCCLAATMLPFLTKSVPLIFHLFLNLSLCLMGWTHGK